MNEPPAHRPAAAGRTSRGERKRAARAVLDLARELVALPPGRRATLALPEELDAAVARVRGMQAHGAHKRELGWLAGRLRAAEPAQLERLRAALDRDPASGGAARTQRIDALAQRLLEDAGALEGLLDAHPGIDRQHLRSLLRAARGARPLQADAPPPPAAVRARRALLRFLRELPDL